MSSTRSATIAEQYRFAVDSFVELARALTAAEWGTTVPCTPAWTARDVLSHVSGIPDDAAAGRMTGAPGEAWTAAQVERNRDATVDELLDRWIEQAPSFAAMIDQIGEPRPPIDCHSHEHDVRHALGRAGNRDNELIDRHGVAMAAIADAPVRLVVEFVDGRTRVSGAGGADVVLPGVTPFEVFRSRLGRRSRDQVRSYRWVGADSDIDAVIERWFSFGPSLHPIVEP